MRMTRFNISLEEGVDMVMYALKNHLGGEIFIPKIPSYKISDVASAIAPSLPQKEIGIHAVRGGTIVGEHDILFAGNDEFITLSHQATSKEVFATGAIKAAQFLTNKTPGLYNMDHLLDA